MACLAVQMMSKRIVVIGGGAAGMMAAVSAAECGARVVLLEPNERLGKKLNITGKGRCNVTNNTDTEGLLANIPRNGKFLYSAFSHFDSADTMAFFEGLGVPLKTERGNRVFPVSDCAFDISAALERRLKALHVQWIRDRAVSLETEDGAGRRGRARKLSCGRGDSGHRRRQLSRNRLHRGRPPDGGGSGAHRHPAPGLSGAFERNHRTGDSLCAAAGAEPAERGTDGLRK